MEIEFENIKSTTEDKTADINHPVDINSLLVGFDHLDVSDESRDILNEQNIKDLEKAFDYLSKKGNGKLTQREWDIYIATLSITGPKPDIDNIPDVDEPEIYPFEEFVNYYRQRVKDMENVAEELKYGISELFDPEKTGFVTLEDWKSLAVDNPNSFVENEDVGFMCRFTEVIEGKFNYVKFIDVISPHKTENVLVKIKPQ